jgi:hypothetical protein
MYEPMGGRFHVGFDRNPPASHIANYFAGSVVDHSTDLASFS